MSSLLDVAPVVPVVVLEDATRAVPLARALAAGGLPIIELTLRTPSALDAVRRIAAEVPDVLVGAGTILGAGQARRAAAAGARFLVSPGSTPALLDGLDDTGLPYLPGTSTVSEMLAVAERGHTAMKFFPAEAAGGAPYLASLASPLPHLRFCPTGGITATTAERYLGLPNVGCVGGSWLTPADAVAAGDWARITRLAAEVALPLAA
jgi:2-dehydro-3-deoxyphosphogluconate aldolase/(4S)-4-hydroxy-2-oxoglutarate aldolase